eukprot:TRINITY_DN12939_c0_g1_i1.p1 TRINITY_DN12939_c0_g1~~TRINITY_DN12939_c0_g1_i1.p1  ORF type:complete len:288 (+),score=26.59 TRINITY_DN12939_c0_g1_i1:68-931(+)
MTTVESIPQWHSFLAGNIGGMTGLFFSYPLDTIKIRLQTSPQYRNMVHCFSSMIKREGAFSLYRGIPAPLIGYGAISAMAFGTYNYVINMFANVTLLNMIIAGGCAGFTSCLVRSPVERVKTVMQYAKKPDGSALYRNTLQCAVALVREHGLVRGIYRGLGLTMVREVYQYGVYYPTYHILKNLLKGDDGKISRGGSFFAGSIAGIVQWLPPSFCVDVLKSRMQKGNDSKYGSIKSTFVGTYKEGGMRVFVKGLTPTLLRAAPLHGFTFLGYELVMTLLSPTQDNTM